MPEKRLQRTRDAYREPDPIRDFVKEMDRQWTKVGHTEYVRLMGAACLTPTHSVRIISG